MLLRTFLSIMGLFLFYSRMNFHFMFSGWWVGWTFVAVVVEVLGLFLVQIWLQAYVECRPSVTYFPWRWFFLCPSHDWVQNTNTAKPSLLFPCTVKCFVFHVHFFSESIVYQGCQIEVGNTFQASLKLRNSKTNLRNAMAGTLQTTSFLCQLTSC